MRELVAFVGFAIFVWGLAGVIAPAKARLRTRKRAALVMLGAFIGTGVFGALFGPTEQRNAHSEISAPQPTIRGADKAVSGLTGTDTFLAIDVDLSEQGDDNIEQAAQIASEIGQAIKSGAADIGPKVRKISIFYRVPEKDRLGNDAQTKLMTLYFNVSDLRHANYAGLGANGILNLATSTEISPATASHAVATFCAENRGEEAVFCGQTENQVRLPTS